MATRRFYMARAPTPSHKSTLPSPSYRPASIVSSLPGPPSPLIGRSDSPVRHFPTPWQSCNRRTAWMDPIITPFWTEDEGPAPCPKEPLSPFRCYTSSAVNPWISLILKFLAPAMIEQCSWCQLSPTARGCTATNSFGPSLIDYEWLNTYCPRDRRPAASSSTQDGQETPCPPR